MKAQKFRKYIVRSIVAIMMASLVSSCAYDSSYAGNYPSSNYPSSGSSRGTGDSFAPLLIGAAAIGAIALAKRHSDKKRDRRHDHYRNHGNHHYNRYNHRRPNYNYGRTHINHSGYARNRYDCNGNYNNYRRY